MAGAVEHIHLVAEHGGPPRAVSEVAADAGLGLRGDRHHGPRGADITLIEGEAIDGVASDQHIDLDGGLSRRNVTTRGVDLGTLVGRRFRVGEVICVGEERCEPCRHLASLTVPGVLRGLVHTGLRASIVEGGRIRLGDPVELAL